MVEESNITSHHDCETINGSTKWHSFKSSNASTWTIWTRELACFCDSCIAGNSKACINTEWVEEWKQRSLTPIGGHDQHEIFIEDESQLIASEDYERVFDLVQEGNLCRSICSFLYIYELVLYIIISY